ncbi:MAG: disulfide bond formation protein DsbA [Alphaproteobacteria bacterium]|jgi:2-hydroxychromene-2-carboxylate isomerase|nr:disulfide bond formation protein DsbA [Alphaproteobacteria bacterium]
MSETAIIKMYSDYKSPYAFLAFEPAFELEERYNVRIKWRPFQLRLKGKGQRSIYSEWKVKYSYMDVRRNANLLYGGKMLRGPLKIFDTTPALIGGLFAEKHGLLKEYSTKVFAGFFKREFAADDPEAVIEIISELGLSADNYQEYLSGDGVDAYEQSHEEAVEDQIFGVPLFVFNGEQFWGHDRIWLLEHVLKEAGLEKT